MDLEVKAESLNTKQIAKILSQNTFLEQENIKLKTELSFYRKELFGQRSEKRTPITANPNQLYLGQSLEPSEQVEELEKEKISYERKKRKRTELAGNMNETGGLQFDDSVPIIEVKLPNPELKGLSKDDYETIKELHSYSLAQIPASYKVIKQIQEVVKIKSSDNLSKNIKLDSVLEGSYADVSLLANLLIDKFQYHLPLYRQHQRIKAAGIKINRASLTNYVHRSCDLLKPIHQALLSSITSDDIVWMDETPIKAGHSKSKKKLKQGYIWSIFGKKKEVAFSYNCSRASYVVDDILGDDFSGVLQSDGYEAYSKYVKELSSVEHAMCWSHTRRKFLKAEKLEPQLVDKALEFIQRLYLVESKFRDAEFRDAEFSKIQKIRGDKSKLIVDEFYLWLEDCLDRRTLLASNYFTQAVNYALKHEKELRVFLSNPEVSLDTNHLEREIRAIAIGRKNWMFCWSELGAEYAAIAYSIIGSCKLHDINPYQYLVDVLQRVQTHPSSDVKSLIPRIWKNKFKDERKISIVDVKDFESLK